MEKITGKIENWRKRRLFNIIEGDLYNDIHQRWEDGIHMHTSSIKGLYDMELREGDKVTTMNSTYLLGKPHANS